MTKKKKSTALKNLDFLRLLSVYSKKNINTKKFKSLLLHSSANEIKAISEIIYNYIHGNLKCKSANTNKLARYKKNLRSLSDKKASSKSKRLILQRTGRGFLFPILTAAIPALISLFKKKIN